MPRRRLGVAVLVPEPLATEIDGLRRACGDGALGRVPAHLTLVPPVNVRKEQLGDALAVLRAAAAAVEPFVLTLGPVATFLPSSPVLFLAAGGADDAVACLARLRGAVFAPPLSRPLAWPFVPHVTLCDDGPADRLSAAVSALHYQADLGVTRVTLLEEHRDDDGVRRWRPLADADCGEVAVVARGGLALEFVTGSVLDPEAQALIEADAPAAAGAARRLAVERPRSDGGPFVVCARRLAPVDAEPAPVQVPPVEHRPDSDAEDVPADVVAAEAPQRAPRPPSRLVGVAWGASDGPTAWLDGLVVAAAARGEGVGHHLLAAAVHRAALVGAHRVVVDVPTGTSPERFLLRHGFTPEPPDPDVVTLVRHL